MAGFFKRLTRLARAEFRSLGSRFSSDREAQAADEALKAELQGENEGTENSSWPKEIREAYAALEIPLGSDEATVKDAYRSMMQRYHPDKHHSQPERLGTANELTMALRGAYEKLLAFLKQRNRAKS